MPFWPMRPTFSLDSHDDTWRYYYTHFFVFGLSRITREGNIFIYYSFGFEVDCYIMLTISYAFKVYVASC